jgi:hypothetical protein
VDLSLSAVNVECSDTFNKNKSMEMVGIVLQQQQKPGDKEEI